MKNSRQLFAAALIFASLVILLHGVTFDHRAEAGPNDAETTVAAPKAGKTVGRLQVSAYGNGTIYGCFVVDTATGELWQSTSAQPQLKQVSGGVSFVH